jgi:hypothetical protein
LVKKIIGAGEARDKAISKAFAAIEMLETEIQKCFD